MTTEVPWPKRGDHFQCPFCYYSEGISLEDPDASFSEILGHIRWVHPNEDVRPGILWPRIRVVNKS